MPTKKSTSKKTSAKQRRKNGAKTVRVLTPSENIKWVLNSDADGDEFHQYPIRRNPEPSPEAEAKRLARRKALTLRAFQTAYENYHSRKAS